MKRLSLCFFLLILLAACTGRPTVTIPTLAVLPTATATPTATWTQIQIPSPTITVSNTDTDTPLPTLAPSDTATHTATSTATNTATATSTASLTSTFTPSLTITNTVTPTPSPTFTPSPELDSLGLLALLSQRATILPPQMLYNPQTLTAVAYAAQTLIATQSGIVPPPTAGSPELATLPPPVTIACAVALPNGLSGAFTADATLTQGLGCPQGVPLNITTAVQVFEHGSMLYLQGSPGSIYMLTLDGRFRRFDDTWVQGVDPETGGETPPLGMIEPKRGFGKVWRNNLDVRGSLGWAITPEEGATSSLLMFDHGRAVFLPTRNQTDVLIDDPSGQTGSWRSLQTSF